MKICRQYKSFNPTQVVYAADPLLRRWSWCYSYIGWLCGFYYGALHVESYLALCYQIVVLSVIVSIVIISLVEERAGLFTSRAFDCLSYMR